MSHECPTCGSVGFKTEAGMKTHHAQVHGESIAGFEYTCDWCGESGTKRQIDEDDDHQFCSKECYGEWKSENLVGEDSPAWEGRTIVVECEWCGSDTEKAAVRYEKNERAFCSMECHGAWKSKNHSGENHPRWVGRLVDIACDQCGSAFKQDPSKIERNERNFCSKSCYSSWMSENNRGEDHPRWVENPDHISYGGSWPVQREKRLEKDDYECVICGKSDAQEEIDTGKGLDVHHIEKARNYLKDDGTLDEEKAHRIENLISLCRSCHIRWEGIPLRPEVYDQ